MKLRETNSEQSILTVFTNLGATPDEVGCIKNYLESENEDDSLLADVKMRNLKSVGYSISNKCKDIQVKLTRANEDEMCKRFIKALFAIGGSTVSEVIYRYGQYDTQVYKYLTEAQYTAVYAENAAWSEYELRETSILSFKKRCMSNPDMVMEAVKYSIGEHDNARVLMLGFAYNTILSQKDKAQDAETLKKFKTDYVDNIIDSVCHIASGISQAEVKMLNDYIDNYSDGMQPSPAIMSICRKAELSSYLSYLLCGTSALNLEYSSHLRGFLQLCMSIDIYTACSAVMTVNKSDCDRIFTALEGFAILDFVKYFIWCAKSNYADPVKRLYESKQEEYDKAIEKLDIDEYDVLVSAIEKIDPQKYTKLKNDTDAVKNKVAKSVAQHVVGEEQNALEYILGEITLDELRSRVNFHDLKLNVNRYCYEPLEKYKNTKGTDELVRRSYIVYAMIGKYSHITRMLKSNYENGCRVYSEISINSIFEMFEAEGLPLEYLVNVAEALFDYTYGDDEKSALAQVLARCILYKVKENPEEFYSAVQYADAHMRNVALLAFGADSQAYKEQILRFAADTSKVVRANLISILGKNPDWEQDVLNLLKSKKSTQREIGVNVLSSWGVEKYRDMFTAMLEKEKSKAVIDLINNALGNSSNGNTAAGADAVEDSAKQIADRLLKGGKIRSVQWLGDLPEVKMADGTPAEPNYAAAVMLAYSSMSIPGISQDAAKIAATLDAGSLDKYACEVFSHWIDDGAQSKKKWVLYFASIHGGREIAQSLISYINKWPQESRGAIAAEAVKALALNSAPEALLTVDTISRKFKFKQVKAAAVEALKFAASQLGISTEELADRIVPDLGFNERMEKTIDYGTRQFTVRLNPALEVEVFDANGKRMKNLPSPGQKDDPNLAPEAYNEFKALKKSIKATVNTQKIRMELALSTGRKWQSDAWNKLFVCNPIMHQFAMSLIWGVYEIDDCNEKLVQTFRYMEDGTFNTEDEDEYELPENAVIGLVHPLELSEESISVWKEQLEDYEVKQCIEQLDRPIYKPSEEELETDRVLVGAGKMLNGLSLLGKMTTLGWYKGSVQDGGCFYNFYRENVAEGINVQVSFSGMYVAGEDADVTVFDAVFYKAGTVEYGSYVYDDIKPENVVRISDLPPRVYSETALHINRATVSSTMFNENWRKEK